MKMEDLLKVMTDEQLLTAENKMGWIFTYGSTDGMVDIELKTEHIPLIQQEIERRKGIEL
jgi:hypothetical protein